MRDFEEIKSEISQITDEKERLAYFKKLVKEFDKADALNNRKHCRSERRDGFNLAILDSAKESTYPVPGVFKRLCNSDNWEDIIFSRRPEDLHELVTDTELINAIKGLGSKRKYALFYRIVHGYSAEEIGDSKGLSDRNMRKLCEKAIREIRERIGIDKQ